ncbi:hypothetical protein DIPPA_51461 [Diplonema papillatum]|nr:hypothetical protein DIPPA_51461 [Diplonema papillatum]
MQRVNSFGGRKYVRERTRERDELDQTLSSTWNTQLRTWSESKLDKAENNRRREIFSHYSSTPQHRSLSDKRAFGEPPPVARDPLLQAIPSRSRTEVTRDLCQMRSIDRARSEDTLQRRHAIRSPDKLKVREKNFRIGPPSSSSSDTSVRRGRRAKTPDITKRSSVVDLSSIQANYNELRKIDEARRQEAVARMKRAKSYIKQREWHWCPGSSRPKSVSESFPKPPAVEERHGREVPSKVFNWQVEQKLRMQREKERELRERAAADEELQRRESRLKTRSPTVSVGGRTRSGSYTPIVRSNTSKSRNGLGSPAVSSRTPSPEQRHIYRTSTGGGSTPRRSHTKPDSFPATPTRTHMRESRSPDNYIHRAAAESSPFSAAELAPIDSSQPADVQQLMEENRALKLYIMQRATSEYRKTSVPQRPVSPSINSISPSPRSTTVSPRREPLLPSPMQLLEYMWVPRRQVEDWCLRFTGNEFHNKVLNVSVRFLNATNEYQAGIVTDTISTKELIIDTGLHIEAVTINNLSNACFTQGETHPHLLLRVTQNREAYTQPPTNVFAHYPAPAEHL